MANLTLVYGMRLLPSEDVLEGSKEEIEKQLRTSLEAFFDLYPEI